jgi:hypothetical protein
MSELIATKRVDLLAPYLALDQGSRVQAECELVFPSRVESDSITLPTNRVTPPAFPTGIHFSSRHLTRTAPTSRHE